MNSKLTSATPLIWGVDHNQNMRFLIIRMKFVESIMLTDNKINKIEKKIKSALIETGSDLEFSIARFLMRVTIDEIEKILEERDEEREDIENKYNKSEYEYL